MAVTHVSFIFSPMRGVLDKLDAMRLAAEKGFPELTLTVCRFYEVPRIFCLALSFLKGFFIPLREDTIIIRHTFFDPTLIIALWIRTAMGRKTYLEHHSDHIAEFRLRGVVGRGFVLWEIFACRLASRFFQGHLCVSTSVSVIQRRYFSSGDFIIFSNGYSIPKTNMVEIDESRVTRRRVLVTCAAKFASWHGLDKLAQLSYDDDFFRTNFDVIVIGETFMEAPPENFQLLGNLPLEEVVTWISKADICADSLALSRLGLTESSSLKGKQYVSHAVPILAEVPVHPLYRKFTFFWDAKPSLGYRLENWLASLDPHDLRRTAAEIYDSEISWESALRSLRSQLVR